MKTFARHPVAISLIAAFCATAVAPAWADPDAAKHGLSKYENRERDADAPGDKREQRDRREAERAAPPPRPQERSAPPSVLPDRSATERMMRPGGNLDTPPVSAPPRAPAAERPRPEPTRPGFTNESGFVTTPVPNGRRENGEAGHHNAQRWDDNRRPDNNGWQNNAPRRPDNNTWSADNRRNDDRRWNDNDRRRDDNRWRDDNRPRDDNRWRDDDRWRNDRQPRANPRSHVDVRINIDRRYPTYGHVIHTLPRGYRQVPHRGGDYWFHGGVWYRPHGSSWVVVRPPLGVSISVLPPFYTTLWFAGIPYYYANGLYYQWRPYERHYVVVDPPRDIDTSGDIDWYEELYVYPTAGQSEQQEADDRYECHRWAVDQTRFDPTQPPENMTRRQYADAWDDYRRASIACLEARNYSVE